ncbi:MAG: family 16 glycoside hydrolase [Limisphaerales bacterium]
MRNLFFCLGLVLSLSAYGTEIRFDFSDFSAGSTPTNFTSALAGEGQPGDWKIVMDDVPPLLAPLTAQAPEVAKRTVLAQVSRNPTDERFPLFIYDREKFTDFTFSTRFKIVGGVVEQMAGLVFRYQNVSNYYVVRVSALGHNVRFYERVNGVRTMDPIGPSIVGITNGTWHTLAVQCQGNQMMFWLDDKLVMPPLQNNTFTEGKVGFMTKSDAVSYFCDAKIEYTPRIPAAQELVDGVMEKQPRILGLRIYMLDNQGEPRVIASKDPAENGQPGNETDKKAITDGVVFYGKHDGVDMITLPLRDHNGDPVGAVRLWLKSFLGETQNNAITRARIILKSMEAEVTSAEQLRR